MTWPFIIFEWYNLTFYLILIQGNGHALVWYFILSEAGFSVVDASGVFLLLLCMLRRSEIHFHVSLFWYVFKFNNYIPSKVLPAATVKISLILQLRSCFISIFMFCWYLCDRIMDRNAIHAFQIKLTTACNLTETWHLFYVLPSPSAENELDVIVNL